MRFKFRKKVICLMGAGIFTALTAFGSYAFPGWENTAEGWRYLDAQNFPMTDVIKSSDGRWFYLGSDGYMVKDSIIRMNDDIYCFGSDGVMLVNTWKFISPEETENDEFSSGWYYFGYDGKATRKRGNSKCMFNVSGKDYFFDENGLMLTGWIDRDGSAVLIEDSDNENPFVDGLYYASEDGSVLKEEWLEYANEDWKFSGSDLESNITGRDYDDYESMWFYFRANGEKVYAKEDKKLREYNIDNKKFSFDENGVMNPSWTHIASFSNIGRNDRYSEERAKYFSGYEDGSLRKNSWFWMWPSENLDPKDYFDRESSWWRSDGRGKVYRDKIQTVNGRRYAFDGIGRMQTGFVFYHDGNHGFAAKYEMDDYERADFIPGISENDISYVTDRNDMYLFSPDEMNDGSMQTGKDIKVDLADGVYTFGFKENGKAYGNRGIVEKVDKRFYVNGLLLTPENERFGVVKYTRGSDTDYYVVNSNGRIVNGRKKVLDLGSCEYILSDNGKFIAYIADLDKPRWKNGPNGAGFYRYDKDYKHNIGEFIAGKGDCIDPEGLYDDLKINFR